MGSSNSGPESSDIIYWKDDYLRVDLLVPDGLALLAVLVGADSLAAEVIVVVVVVVAGFLLLFTVTFFSTGVTGAIVDSKFGACVTMVGSAGKILAAVVVAFTAMGGATAGCVLTSSPMLIRAPIHTLLSNSVKF